MTKTAVILAAGRGARLNGIGSGLPKCLVKVGGVSLIERQIRALKDEGISKIVIVVGYGAPRVKEICGAGIDYVENVRYGETNSLFSLWLARGFLGEGFVVLNADVLFHNQLLRNLLRSRFEDALLVGYREDLSDPLGLEEMKVKVRSGRVADISKRMNPIEADGENVGIARFGASGARLLIEKMEALIEGGGDREWAPAAFREFCADRPLRVIGTRGYPWIEIDFPEDYRRAVEVILPMIDAPNSAAPACQVGSMVGEGTTTGELLKGDENAA